jgi:hypothetical protein
VLSLADAVDTSLPSPQSLNSLCDSGWIVGLAASDYRNAGNRIVTITNFTGATPGRGSVLTTMTDAAERQGRRHMFRFGSVPHSIASRSVE